MSSTVLGILLLAGAAAALTFGAELFIENIAGAAQRLGLTVLAVATLFAGAEPEEALTAGLASWKGDYDLAAGDAIGANITMLTAVLGLAALVRPLPVRRRVRGYAIGAVFAALAAHLVVADGVVSRLEGAGLVALYTAMAGYVWWRERTSSPADDSPTREGDADDEVSSRRPGVALLLALVGLVVMTSGGALAVDGAQRVVNGLGVSQQAIGLTALSLATTAELFALVFAGIRRDVPEVAVAGVIGSAVFNSTVTIGLAALVHPLELSDFRAISFVAMLLPLVIILLAWRGKLNRLAGALLTASYVAFLYVTLTSGKTPLG